MCDGPVILGCVGGMREAPFTRRETDVFAALAHPLQRNLQLRRRLLDAGLTRAGFDAALGWLDAPAFIVAANGEVAHANAVGVARLDRDRQAVEARLREAIAGQDAASDVARISSPGLGSVHLVVLREAEATFDQRVVLAFDRWRLTAREVEVLRMIAVGDSNKEIARRLECHEGTVERHVTSILRKSRCESRSRLVARFWTAQ